MADEVTASSLRKHLDVKHQTNHQTYRMIFTTVAHKLDRVARSGASECRVDIPGYMFGRPFYEVRHAAKYVMRKLQHRGFVVTREPGASTMVASWERKKKKKRRRSREREPRPDPTMKSVDLQEPMLTIQERVDLLPPPQSSRPEKEKKRGGGDADGPTAKLLKDISDLL